ncbi:MAG TPA: DUF1573 domain-containing protein [Pirellulales bacterium]|nr:DUF1573 domain-containing protein [Pirellulales bacterium]
MKTQYVVVAAVLAGGALGAGISWANFGNPPPFNFTPSEAPASANQQEAQPKVLVDNRAYDFGAVERDIKVSHTFRFTNVGTAPLTLRAGATTCSRCTITTVSQGEVPPGESAEVTVEYLPGISKMHFRQVATVHTNDPHERRVELNIFGTVTSRYRVEPPEISLSKISAAETKTTEFNIYAFQADAVSVVSHSFAEPDTAEFFDVQSEPLEHDQLTVDGARSGCVVRVTVKPGLPLGAIRQTIRLRIALAGSQDTPEVEVPVSGKVDSEISIVGRNWNGEFNKLTLGSVKSSEGLTHKLFVVLRGPLRHGVKIKPARVIPDWIQVSLGEPSELKKDGPDENGVSQIPLTIVIPPGAPPSNHLGSDQGKYGEIILETTHPQVKQIRMYLQFIVEQ